MKLRLALVTLLLAPSLAAAQTTVPLTNGQAVIPAQNINVVVQGVSVPITIPSQTVPVTGNTVVPAGSGGGGTTYTQGPGICITGTVISECWKSVAMAFTSGSHAIVGTDLMQVQIITSATPVTVAFPAASTINTANSGNAVELMNLGAGSVTLTGVTGQPQVMSGGLNQSLEVRIDPTGATWLVDRGTGQ